MAFALLAALQWAATGATPERLSAVHEELSAALLPLEGLEPSAEVVSDAESRGTLTMAVQQIVRRTIVETGSLRRAAEQLGIHYSTVSRISRGKVTPTFIREKRKP